MSLCRLTLALVLALVGLLHVGWHCSHTVCVLNKVSWRESKILSIARLASSFVIDSGSYQISWTTNQYNKYITQERRRKIEEVIQSYRCLYVYLFVCLFVWGGGRQLGTMMQEPTLFGQIRREVMIIKIIW